MRLRIKESVSFDMIVHRVKAVAIQAASVSLDMIVHRVKAVATQAASIALDMFNPLTLNDHYSGRTAPLTSKRCVLYIYSTNMGTEYFKRGIYSQFFPLRKCSLFHNSNVFGFCIIHILYTGCAKIKKK